MPLFRSHSNDVDTVPVGSYFSLSEDLKTVQRHRTATNTPPQARATVLTPPDLSRETPTCGVAILAAAKRVCSRPSNVPFSVFFTRVVDSLVMVVESVYWKILNKKVNPRNSIMPPYGDIVVMLGRATAAKINEMNAIEAIETLITLVSFPPRRVTMGPRKRPLTTPLKADMADMDRPMDCSLSP